MAKMKQTSNYLASQLASISTISNTGGKSG
jgi:hypothetical protein